MPLPLSNKEPSHTKKAKPATIKGVFVNSHIRALRDERGEAAVEELARRFGAPLRFGTLEDVPVRDEVRLIELILDLTVGHGLEGTARAEAAGTLHFKNFSQTTLGSMLLGTGAHTPEGFVSLVRTAPTIARSVFLHSGFATKDYGDCVVVTISNCDYPPEHFAGFFAEWMRIWELGGIRVETRNPHPGTFEYWLHFKRH